MKMPDLSLHAAKKKNNSSYEEIVVRMEKSLIAIMVFCFISIVISFIFHKKIKKYVLASFLSSLVTVIIYQIVGCIILGYLDPFFLIAAIYSFIVALVISFVIGLIITKYVNSGMGEQRKQR